MAGQKHLLSWIKMLVLTCKIGSSLEDVCVSFSLEGSSLYIWSVTCIHTTYEILNHLQARFKMYIQYIEYVYAYYFLLISVDN